MKKKICIVLIFLFILQIISYINCNYVYAKDNPLKGYLNAHSKNDVSNFHTGNDSIWR